MTNKGGWVEGATFYKETNKKNVMGPFPLKTTLIKDGIQMAIGFGGTKERHSDGGL